MSNKSKYNLNSIKIHTRQCHDCKKKTTNYRCESCLTAWKLKHSVSGKGEEYSPSSIVRPIK